MKRTEMLVVCAAMLSIAMPVQAFTCYQIRDAQDNMTYQSPSPPFTLAGLEYDRSMTSLRAKRSHLIYFESASCAQLVTVAHGDQQTSSSDPASLLPDRPTSRIPSAGAIFGESGGGSGGFQGRPQAAGTGAAIGSTTGMSSGAGGGVPYSKR